MTSAIRIDPRLACDLDAILHDGDERRRVRVVDVSRSGALVEVSPLPEVGKTIRLQFSLPVADDPVVADCEVMRHLTYECGVRFTNIAPEVEGTLEKYLFVRTCQFGWLSSRRLFASFRQLAGTFGVVLLAGLVVLFGGRQLIRNMPPNALVENFGNWIDLGLVLLAMAPAAIVATLGYGLHLAPHEVRQVLLFGSDPVLTLQQNIEAIRRAFGLSRRETESLAQIHVTEWRLPAQRVRVFIRLMLVFALFYTLMCTVAVR